MKTPAATDFPSRNRRPMNLLCPTCQKMLQVPEQFAGQDIRCPLCGSVFEVPPRPAGAGAPAAIPPRPDEAPNLPDLGGKYLPLHSIAGHSRSLAFAARQAAGGRLVFIKMLHAALRGDAAAARAFRNEPALLQWLAARAAAEVVPPVLEVGDWDGRPYFVQPLLPGWGLARAMRARPAFTGASALRLVEGCLRQLHLIHGAGVAHGDVSPENLFVVTEVSVAEDGVLPAAAEVRLVDFDAARRVDGPENRPGVPVVGKAPYLAPECAAGRPFSAQSDLYALGIVFYEMLAGERPYPAASLQEVRALTEHSVPPLPLALGVPPPIEELLRALLAVDPDRRIGSAAEALRRLQGLHDVHRWLAAEDGAPVAALRSRLAPEGVLPRQERATTASSVLLDLEAAEDERELAPTGMVPERASAPVPEAPVPPEEREEVRTAWGGGPASPAYHAPEAAAEADGETALDENVQFTVYRPRAVRPQKWYPLLAFAHLSERPPDAPADEPDPIEEVKRQAAQVLGAQAAAYQGVTQDSSQAVPQAGEITFLPEVPGFEVNPPRRTFRWREAVHREEFRLAAPASLDGQTVRGRLSVFWGSILLAEVALTIRVDSSLPPEAPEAPGEAERARPYRKIFASYSHKDRAIVEQVEQLARALGDRYLRDWVDLRAGEAWHNRLEEMIAEADVFQLFWSRNAMHSTFVRQEWEYALSLDRPSFVRPTYWEDPLPCAPELGLPPESLRRLHFQRLPSAAPSAPASPAPPPPVNGGKVSRREEGSSGGETGTRIGPYLTVKRMGQGGFGSVLLARHAALGYPVVIKLLPEAEHNREHHRALLAEARNVVRLRHPLIARLLDLGRHEGSVYLVREHVEGESLENWLRAQRPTVAEAVSLCTRMAGVLHYAHEAGFVHRDLKPGNVVLGAGGNPTFLAEHFALREGGTYFATFSDRQLYGTPLYMSPERIAGERHHDRRSDIYALGVILFELLTGVRPFEGRNMVQLLGEIMSTEPPSPRGRNPEVPVALEAVCAKCLRKNPVERYATAAALSADLRLSR